MMFSHPVLLGFFWSLLTYATSGQAQISSQDNKVYAYSYHFQHNGTTNSKDILRSVLGTDPEFGFNHDGPSIVKTFSSPSIRGFFTKGVLPAGPASHSFNSGFRSSFNSNPAVEEIKRIVQSNLQPPSTDITRGLLPPLSPNIRNGFPNDFANVNDIGLNFQKQDDFPKIPPPPPPPAYPNNFPKIPRIPNNFPEVPLSPPSIPPVNLNLPNIIPQHQSVNNNGVNRIENFERNTPDGKIVGQIERFSYNSPPISNPNSNFQENAEGYRRKENFVNNNQDVTGHRTQTYFRQEFRTVTPNLESNSLLQNSRRDFRNAANSNNNNNQWWNVLNVLGEKNNNKNKKNDNVNNSNNNNNNNYKSNNNNNKFNDQNFGRVVDQNINQIRNNLHNQINQAFGSRLTNGNDRQAFARKDSEFQTENVNKIDNNQNRNFNNNSPNQGFQGNIPLNNRIPNTIGPNQQNNNRFINNQQVDNAVSNTPYNNNRFENPKVNNPLNNHQQNLNNQFNNDDTTRRVLNVINDVSSRLSNSPDKLTNEIGVTWDDVVAPKITSQDWSRRQSFGTGRPFSNGHSGPLNNPVRPKPDEVVKTSIEALVGGRELPLSPISNVGDNGNSYRNVGGGGIEKFYGVSRVIEGPNSFSQNTHHGVERNFQVNSNGGYQRSNQWSTNTVRRLDVQSTRDDFSKDFIDVFREDY